MERMKRTVKHVFIHTESHGHAHKQTRWPTDGQTDDYITTHRQEEMAVKKADPILI